MTQSYLSILASSSNHIKAVDTNFSHDLIRHGWNYSYKKYFLHLSSSKYARKTKTKPTLETPIILIPFHINDSITRQQVNGHIDFYYADNMNSSNIAHIIKTCLSNSATSQDYHPSNARWHVCPSFTYFPHSNECGPRTLLALSIFALHPAPHSGMLLTFMNNNIAQISRWWVAWTILRGSIILQPLLTQNDQCNQPNPFSWNQSSYPANLAPLHKSFGNLPQKQPLQDGLSNITSETSILDQCDR